MFGFGNKAAIEAEMAEWLASPMEYGVAPQEVHWKRAYKGTIPGHGKVKIHLVEYVMPDGRRGRGFVNGPFTWSFLGERVNAIEDDHLLMAYCGWMGVFHATQTGRMVTEFESDGEGARYLALKEAMGYTDIEVKDRYKMGPMEFVEFLANYQGTAVRVAGNTTAEIGFGSDDPNYQLPAIFFLFGKAAAKDVG